MSTIQALAQLNQRFYAEHAENFADARPRLPAGVQRVLAGIAAGARVLEAGCGDGKVGRALARAGAGAYVGLDASEAMLERAKRYTSTVLPGFVYLLADLISPKWSDVLAGQSFDWVLSFALFHHLPSYDLRAGLLQTLAHHLAPGGRIALSNWRFMRSERVKQRIVPWAAVGRSAADVEPRDYLLSWERKGQHGLRYLHLLEEPEAKRMAAEAGLQVVETFSADGVTGDLSEYVVMALPTPLPLHGKL